MDKWLKTRTLKRSASRTEIKSTDLATMEIAVDQQDDNHEVQRPTDCLFSQSKFDVALDRLASRIAAEFIIFLEFFSLILGVDQLAASRLQLDSRNLPEFL
ncbi:hypothetical protein AVEN_65644-1 [Araneus ventricosus]|uniref:Uncharacterized protein n=1 Tax=Araneus ventricosus TaxID=182803 RepID=A0A4Y2J0D5_ARAVE|nr:hypothetical protein AVEN_65644-1 [Araneus ventricosus]